MRHRFLLLTASVFILLAISACKNRDIRNISEGEIHYSIDAKSEEGLLSRDLMPKTLIVSFKKDRTLFSITTPIGGSGISNLADPQKNIYDTYLNMLGWRYSYQGALEETPPGMQLMDGIIITKTGKTQEIIGLNCYHAEVSLPMMPDTIYNIWYTDEIKISNPNAATPFRELDGVLVNFFLYMGNKLFVFEAESLFSKEINERVFNRREKYREIPKDEMENLIMRMMEL